MKTFTGPRTAEDKAAKAAELGWVMYTLDFKDRMGKKFGDLHIDVCLRSFGKFIAYNEDTQEPMGTERSFNLDGTQWYDEILEILYIPEVE